MFCFQVLRISSLVLQLYSWSRMCAGKGCLLLFCWHRTWVFHTFTQCLSVNQYILRTFLHARELYGTSVEKVPNGYLSIQVCFVMVLRNSPVIWILNLSGCQYFHMPYCYNIHSWFWLNFMHSVTWLVWVNRQFE